MYHSRWSGLPPEIKAAYSVLITNLAYRITKDDLYELFNEYGEVIDVFIPMNHRARRSRGIAFVRYKHFDEAQKAIDNLDGRFLDGRIIKVKFSKSGPNAEHIHKERIFEPLPETRGRSMSPWRYIDDFRDRDYMRRSRSPSRGRYVSDGYNDREREYLRRSGSVRSITPEYHEGRIECSRDQRDYMRGSRSQSRGRYESDRYNDRERDYPRRSGSARSITPDNHKGRIECVSDQSHKERIIEPLPETRSRSMSPWSIKERIIEALPETRGTPSIPQRYRDDFRSRDYIRRSRSRSRGRFERDRYYDKEMDYRRMSGRVRNIRPDYHKGHRKSSGYQRHGLPFWPACDLLPRSCGARRSLSPCMTHLRDVTPKRGHPSQPYPVPRIASPEGQHVECSCDQCYSPLRSRGAQRSLSPHRPPPRDVSLKRRSPSQCSPLPRSASPKGRRVDPRIPWSDED